MVKPDAASRTGPPATGSPPPRGSRHGMRRRARGVPDPLVGIALLIAAGGAAAWGLPFGLSRLAELPGDGAVRLVYQGERPLEEGYVRLLDSREAALQRAERAGPHRDLGHAYHVLADEFADSEEMRRSLFLRAQRELEASIGRSPADPGALAVLAATLLGLERDEEARRWLDVAHRIAPFSPETALLRSWIALTASAEDEALDEPDFRDMRAAFAFDRARFVQMVRELDADERVLPAFTDEDARYELRVALMRAREEGPADGQDPPR